MSRRYESRQDLANKIDYEGGLEAFLEYGFDPSGDIPKGDDELEDLASTMMYRWREYQEAAGYFTALLPDLEENQ